MGNLNFLDLIILVTPWSLNLMFYDCWCMIIDHFPSRFPSSGLCTGCVNFWGRSDENYVQLGNPEDHMKVTLSEWQLPPWCWWHFWVYGHTCWFYETLQKPDGVAGDSECQRCAGLPCKCLVDVHEDHHTNKTEDANNVPFQSLFIRKARQMWRGAYCSRTVRL